MTLSLKEEVAGLIGKIGGTLALLGTQRIGEEEAIKRMSAILADSRATKLVGLTLLDVESILRSARGGHEQSPGGR